MPIPPENLKETMAMRNWLITMGGLVMLLAGGRLALAQQPVAMRVRPPELRNVEEWINSKPLTLEGLKGKVVVLHYWTFG
jgi:hypothetical protein